MQFKFLFILFFNFFAISFAQSENAIPEEMVYVDSTMSEQTHGIDADSLLKGNFSTENTIFPKKISENYRGKYKEKDFNYDEIKPQESLWTKIKRKFSKIWESIFGNPQDTVNGLQYGLQILAVLVIAVALFFIIKFLMNKDGNFFWSRKNKKVNIASGVLHENIHEINFPITIAELEQKQDFRSAIRYQFLFVLKKMSDQKLIQWNPDKTNTDYIVEIKDASQRKYYEELSYIFENVWYGEQKIDAEFYEKLKSTFLKTNFTTSRIS